MKNQSSMTIGGLAKATNVGVETIRFYERKSLIAQPSKTDGFRHYDGEYVRLIKLIKRLQSVGFSLDEIKEFLMFDRCCSESTNVIRQKSLSKIEEINGKIAELRNTVKALEVFATTCGLKNNQSSSCDLLDCFENEWACCENSVDS